MALTIAIILFVIFGSNVVWGAMTASPVLSDVLEMLVLFAASIAFVVSILQIEKRAAQETHENG